MMKIVILLVAVVISVMGEHLYSADFKTNKDARFDEAVNQGIRLNCYAERMMMAKEKGNLSDEDVKALMADVKLWIEEANLALPEASKESDALIQAGKEATDQFGNQPCSNNRGLVILYEIMYLNQLLGTHAFLQITTTGDTSSRSLLVRGTFLQKRLYEHLVTTTHYNDFYIGMQALRASQTKVEGIQGK